jgi:hypothetical protein
MPQCLEPKLDVLPAAQQEIWTSLAAAPDLNFVLYGGTAIALQLGHRESLDFDFFQSGSKIRYARSFNLSAGRPFCMTRRKHWLFSPKCRPVP